MLSCEVTSGKINISNVSTMTQWVKANIRTEQSVRFGKVASHYCRAALRHFIINNRNLRPYPVSYHRVDISHSWQVRPFYAIESSNSACLTACMFRHPWWVQIWKANLPLKLHCVKKYDLHCSSNAVFCVVQDFMPHSQLKRFCTRNVFAVQAANKRGGLILWSNLNMRSHQF